MQPLPRRWLPVAVLVLAAALPYLPSLRYGFVYDDGPQIVDNPHLSSLRNIPQFFTQSITKNVGFHEAELPVFYRPLFFAQLCVTRVLFGPGPFAFHLLPLLMHVLNALLLYWLASELGLTETVALLAAALFAVHPVHVESVVWPSASPEPMALAAILLSLFAFRKFSVGSRSPRWLALSVAAFLIGLLVKETALILLPIIVVLAIFDRRSAISSSQRATIVASFAAAAMLYLAVRNSVLHALSTTITPSSWADMARTWPSVLWFYVRHLVLPIRPSILYDYDLIEHTSLAEFWLPLFGVLIASVIVGFIAWKHRSPATLIPVLLVILPIILVLNFRVFYWGDLVHDRYLYTPSAGFSILVALGLAELSRRLAENISSAVRLGIAIALLCLLALVTVIEAQPWRNNLLLMSNAVEVAPRNIAAQMMLGAELESRGYFAEAATCYGRALQITPRWAPAWFSFGRTLLLTQDTPNAIRSLEQAVRLDEQPISLVWLSLAVDRAGRHQEAQSLLVKAEARDPSMGLKFADLEKRVRDAR